MICLLSHNPMRLIYRKITCYIIIIVTIPITFVTYPRQSPPYPKIDSDITKLRLVSYLSDISDIVKVREANCAKLFHLPTNKIKYLNSSVTNVGTPIKDEDYAILTTNCSRFQKQRGYIMSSITPEEEDFPLAFSILVFKEAEMVERLFRAIYRPQNYYCIHVDNKSTETFYRGIAAIAECFPNAFLTKRRIDVQWSYYSVLEPELLCMEELWRYPKWRYFINLTGQEFPLKTNFELVKILQAYRGAVDVGTDKSRINKWRWPDDPPLGLTPMKGPVHIVVHRGFVDYVLHNQTAALLLNWTRTTQFPDETFFATLNANPRLGIKGTYLGEPVPSPKRPLIARFKRWFWMDGRNCPGIYIRGICILTTGDLPRLRTAPEMFANKFHLSLDRLVIGCLEEKLFNDTRDEFSGVKSFDTSYYSQLDFVRRQVL